MSDLATTPCTRCGEDVREGADICPHCWTPVAGGPTDKRRRRSAIANAIAGVIVLLILGGLFITWVLNL